MENTRTDNTITVERDGYSATAEYGGANSVMVTVTTPAGEVRRASWARDDQDYADIARAAIHDAINDDAAALDWGDEGADETIRAAEVERLQPHCPHCGANTADDDENFQHGANCNCGGGCDSCCDDPLPHEDEDA